MNTIFIIFRNMKENNFQKNKNNFQKLKNNFQKIKK